jgi:hypothetical protein
MQHKSKKERSRQLEVRHDILAARYGFHFRQSAGGLIIIIIISGGGSNNGTTSHRMIPASWFSSRIEKLVSARRVCNRVSARYVGAVARAKRGRICGPPFFSTIGPLDHLSSECARISSAPASTGTRKTIRWALFTWRRPRRRRRPLLATPQTKLPARPIVVPPPAAGHKFNHAEREPSRAAAPT